MHIHVVVVSTPSPRASFMGKAEKVNAHSRPRGMRSRTRVGNDYPITLDAHRVKSVRARAREKEGVMDGTRDAREKRVFLVSSLVFEANLIRFKLYLGKDHYRCFMFSG